MENLQIGFHELYKPASTHCWKCWEAQRKTPLNPTGHKAGTAFRVEGVCAP